MSHSHSHCQFPSTRNQFRSHPTCCPPHAMDMSEFDKVLEGQGPGMGLELTIIDGSNRTMPISGLEIGKSVLALFSYETWPISEICIPHHSTYSSKHQLGSVQKYRSIVNLPLNGTIFLFQETPQSPFSNQELQGEIPKLHVGLVMGKSAKFDLR